MLHFARRYTFNINQYIYWINSKLNCLIYLIIFFTGFGFIFLLTYYEPNRSDTLKIIGKKLN